MERKLVIGRERETKRLNECYESKESQLVLVYGRRRVGKTFLINQTFDGRFDFKITGAYNQNTDFQLNTFNIELCRQTQKDIPLAKTWLKAFAQLREYLDSFSDDEKRVVFFDEMPLILQNLVFLRHLNGFGTILVLQKTILSLLSAVQQLHG